MQMQRSRRGRPQAAKAPPLKCVTCSTTFPRDAGSCVPSGPRIQPSRQGCSADRAESFRVAFRLHHNGKSILNLPSAQWDEQKAQRVASICGQEFIDNALVIEHSVGDMRLHGWVARPVFSRSQPDLQYFFLNGRCVRDKVIVSAVKQAYRDVLFHGRQPAYVLYLELDPAVVDVNAHPAERKRVRFRDSRAVHDFVRRGVETALAETRPGGLVSKSALLDSVGPGVRGQSYCRLPASPPSTRCCRAYGSVCASRRQFLA